ncbi:selenide, water dikinase SelD [Sulfidibacter corallicola]|uniref:Selenide, water dikinase SelD n=1 Tax=Sulfidibacter corallicola TaxID=2818388 RepID=A0A8A4TT57_SULCO|nr:selenide, water dikinase SelD [Sulfidibacter corallicola]
MGDIFSAIPPSEDPNLLVGFSGHEDGAVYRLDGDRALVQTVDFFTPIVDDPRDFGAIAAANALSDVYAMGARPLTALSLVCYPYKSMDIEILTEIVAGGAEKVCEAGALVVGGHSVGDAEIKFGYAVTGEVHPDAVWRNQGARPGDRLVLTKPLGTGVLTTAVKQDKLPTDLLTEPIAEMKRLNRYTAEAARDLKVHAATDITGFGLLGHLYEMVSPNRLGARVQCDALRLFEGIWEGIEAGALTGAHRTNLEYIETYTVPRTAAFTRYEKAVLDPQTSGGLLFALPADQADVLMGRLEASGHRPSLVGEITDTPELTCC